MTSKSPRKRRQKNKKADNPGNDGGNRNGSAQGDTGSFPKVVPAPYSTDQAKRTWYKSPKFYWRTFELIIGLFAIAYSAVAVISWWQHRKDDRPYVIRATTGNQNGGLMIDPSGKINPNLTTRFQNIGKSTATDLRGFGCMTVTDKIDDASIIALSDHMYDIAIKHLDASKIDIAPTGDYFEGMVLTDDKCTPKAMWDENMTNRFKSGDIYILALVGVVYDGSDGSHETQICSISSGQSRGPNIIDLPHTCPTHNTIR